MGVYSDVGLVVPKDAPRFEEMEGAHFDEVRDGREHRLYVAEGVKWYLEDPLVVAVQDYLKQLDAEDRMEDYLYIILTAEYNSVEYEGACWDNEFNLGYTIQLLYSKDPAYRERFDYELIPELTRKSLNAYIEHHCPTGQFLEHLLSNDLRLAIEYADPQNVKVMHVIMCYLANHAPAIAYGSREAYRTWTKERG